jgi:hypothetical protein
MAMCCWKMKSVTDSSYRYRNCVYISNSCIKLEVGFQKYPCVCDIEETFGKKVLGVNEIRISCYVHFLK